MADNSQNKSTDTIQLPESEGQAQTYSPEVEYGNVEYKFKLIAPTDERIEHLATQMKWRLGEGNGEAFYEIGVEDGGSPRGLSEEELKQSIATLQRVADKAGAIINVLRVTDGINGRVADILVRQCSDDVYLEIRVAVVGNVDAGKSTTLGVLTHNILDNGRGKARVNIFKHQHEVESGRTSSVCNEIMGFDLKGKVIDYNLHGTTSSEIAKQSYKIINFIDLAGHEKYFKTTLFGMSGQNPDYIMLVVGANMGCVGMTKEHLGCALALRVPIFVVITKMDLAPEHVYKETLNQLQKMLKSPGVKKIPIVVKNEDDVLLTAREISSGRIVPIFCVSNINGSNINLIKQFLNFLPSTHDWDSLTNEPVQFSIDNDFSVTGVGTVASGTVTHGCLTMGETLLLGPNEFGEFTSCSIKSVHINRLPVKQARAGMTASVSLKKIERKQIRKGMILVHPSLKPTACMEFDAEVVILYHSTTMSFGYEAVVHCLAVRQAARLIKLDRAQLRTGDKATVTFRFLFFPEYLVPGSRIIFREGRAKGIGRVVSTVPYVPQSNNKLNKKKRSNSDPSVLMTMLSSSSAEVMPEKQEGKMKEPSSNEVRGFYIRNTETDHVRAVFDEDYHLLPNEEYWMKELPIGVQEILFSQKNRSAPRNRTQIISVSFPHLSACKIIDTKTKRERVVFSTQPCFLHPHEEFFVFSLSGGRPKMPNQKKCIRLILNASFSTDILKAKSKDNLDVTLLISYNYHFDCDPATISETEALSLFSIPDYVGYLSGMCNPKIIEMISSVAKEDFIKTPLQYCDQAVFGDSKEKKVCLPNKAVIHSISVRSVE